MCGRGDEGWCDVMYPVRNGIALVRSCMRRVVVRFWWFVWLFGLVVRVVVSLDGGRGAQHSTKGQTGAWHGLATTILG